MDEAYLLPISLRKWYIRRYFEQKENEKQQGKHVKDEPFVHPLTNKK